MPTTLPRAQAEDQRFRDERAGGRTSYSNQDPLWHKITSAYWSASGRPLTGRSSGRRERGLWRLFSVLTEELGGEKPGGRRAAGLLIGLPSGMPAGSLLLLNGPPGIGKSTVGRRLCSGRPLSLCLDIDMLRRSLGQWMDHPERSGALARDLAVAVAERHLAGGHGVVVPQFLGRLEFVDRLEQLAQGIGAPFDHVVLIDDEASAASRFLGRADAADATDQHREAAVMAGGEVGFRQMYSALLVVVEARGVTVLPSTEGDVCGTLARVRAAVAGRW